MINAKDAMTIAGEVANLASLFLFVGRMNIAEPTQFTAQIKLMDKHGTTVHLNSHMLKEVLTVRVNELIRVLESKEVEVSGLVGELEEQLEQERQSLTAQNRG